MIAVTIAAPAAALATGMVIEFHGHTGTIADIARTPGLLAVTLINADGVNTLNIPAAQLVKVTEEWNANEDQADRLADAMRRRLSA
jgi:hypothetical protein